MHLLRGIATTILFALNLAFWAIPIVILGLLKLLVPEAQQRKLILTAAWLADHWVAWNIWLMDRLLPTKWEISGLEGLRRDGHYLIICNHVSWVDIFVLLRVFHDKTPFIRFFIKHELVWMPLVGQAAWALEFPFMKRYSAEYLERHPEKRGKDLETTRKACERYRHFPVTILNFLEGTRFTREKQSDQDSPYTNLLRPRIGGIGFVIASLGEQLEAILDVTLIYPHADMSTWDFVSGRIDRIVVAVRVIDVPREFVDPAIIEPGEARQRFKAWIEEIWRQKDELIERTRPG
jgi:1-acyl-sn-glycerol-3-phosphate acyltransferase